MSVTRRSRVRAHVLALLAETRDAERDDVAGFRYCGGLRPMPTPGGVPVVMMSPGSSVMNWLT